MLISHFGKRVAVRLTMEGWKGTEGFPTASKVLQGCRDCASPLSCCLKRMTCPLTSK